MKRAVKWTSTDVDRRPGRKEQDGQHRPRKGLWRQHWLSTVNIEQIRKMNFTFQSNEFFFIFQNFEFFGNSSESISWCKFYHLILCSGSVWEVLVLLYLLLFSQFPTSQCELLKLTSYTIYIYISLMLYFWSNYF